MTFSTPVEVDDINVNFFFFGQVFSSPQGPLIETSISPVHPSATTFLLLLLLLILSSPPSVPSPPNHSNQNWTPPYILEQLILNNRYQGFDPPAQKSLANLGDTQVLDGFPKTAVVNECRLWIIVAVSSDCPSVYTALLNYNKVIAINSSTLSG